MKLSTTALKPLEAAREKLHDPATAPGWMQSVTMTGLGPRIVKGRPTDEPAIHLVVKRKRLHEKVAPSRRIPRRFEGYRLDVLDVQGEMALEAAPAPGAIPGLGFGTPLVGLTSRKTGIAACAARTADGAPILVTSAHVLGQDERVGLNDGSRAPIGTCIRRIEVLDRQALYGARGIAPSGLHLVDVAAVELSGNIPVSGGLPGGHGFEAMDTAQINRWLPAAAPLVAWSAATRQWRHGRVLSFWPIRRKDGLRALCTVQQARSSVAGDSGGLWLANVVDRFIAVGLHWGVTTDRGSAVALVTDCVASARHLPIASILRTK